MRLQEKIVVKGTIETITGLHIGGSPTALDIGGVDNAVIKDHKGRPYIPGSSIKGKIRSLVEKTMGLASDENRVWVVKPRVSIHMCDNPDCPVCNVFGRNNGNQEKISGETIDIKNTSPTRLLVRDAPLVTESIPENVRNQLDLEWTEVKYENVIDRITSAANPRQMERVPPEAEFSFSLVYDILEDRDRENLKYVFQGIQLLEDDYLGGSGTRGYGRVKFKDLKIYRNTVKDYETGNVSTNKEPTITCESPQSLLENFDKIV